MIKPWPLIKSEPGSSYRVFSVRTDTARSPRTDRDHDFYIIEAGEWVNIIPLTPDGELVLVRQYRHGIRATTLELPGGLVDPGDTPEAAAVRELMEETGYSPQEVQLLGSYHPHPAIMNNLCYTYLARNVRLEQAQNLDQGEDIEVVLVPLKDIPELIKSGQITHSLVITAFYFLNSTMNSEQV
ncbi:MAG: NUDIX hydrolase [Thermincola sp.]|jgi:8-oxo-dGTP pyrophosphatase MutT (NUDIX family)|nr:NUDIX hydrolase [Thermincola sp.]MDT3701841.1 NUDIX hydrolase [Thermincola sp.]